MQKGLSKKKCQIKKLEIPVYLQIREGGGREEGEGILGKNLHLWSERRKSRTTAPVAAFRNGVNESWEVKSTFLSKPYHTIVQSLRPKIR